MKAKVQKKNIQSLFQFGIKQAFYSTIFEQFHTPNHQKNLHQKLSAIIVLNTKFPTSDQCIHSKRTNSLPLAAAIKSGTYRSWIDMSSISMEPSTLQSQKKLKQGNNLVKKMQ